MSRPREIGGHRRTEIVRVPSWAVAIGAVMAGAVGIALFLASFSLILILAPVLIGAAFYIRWRIRRALRKFAEEERRMRSADDADIIDGDYRIIDNFDDRTRR